MACRCDLCLAEQSGRNPRNEGMALLKRLLRRGEWQERHGFISVLGSDGLRYRIEMEGYSGNVTQMGDDGKPQAKVCCHAMGGHDGYGMPDVNHWITQVIAIRTDAPGFMQKAVVNWRRPTPPPKERAGRERWWE